MTLEMMKGSGPARLKTFGGLHMEGRVLGGITFYITIIICLIPTLWFLFGSPIFIGIEDIIDSVKRRKSAKAAKEIWKEKSNE